MKETTRETYENFVRELRDETTCGINSDRVVDDETGHDMVIVRHAGRVVAQREITKKMSGVDYDSRYFVTTEEI